MRFAWLQKQSAGIDQDRQKPTHPLALVRMAYNAVFWIFLLPFIFSAIDYSVGFIAFTIVILVRLVLNLYTNNMLNLTPEEYEVYPFRI